MPTGIIPPKFILLIIIACLLVIAVFAWDMWNDYNAGTAKVTWGRGSEEASTAKDKDREKYDQIMTYKAIRLMAVAGFTYIIYRFYRWYRD